MTRKDILETAEKMVCGQREQDYGTPENNFQVIADLWNVYLVSSERADRQKGIGHVTDKPLNSFDVAMMMALFKIGRIASGTCTDDSLVDACGYLACAGEIKGERVENNTTGTDEDEFSKEELLAVMKKYGTPEPGHELPYICCHDCPVWLLGRCAICGSCDGHYKAARHILKMMKETKNDGETSTEDGMDEDEFSEEELLAVMEKYGKFEPGSELPFIYCKDCPTGLSDHACEIGNTCDGYYDAARHILKTMKKTEDEFSYEELLAVMKKYGKYKSPNDSLPYIDCGDCPIGPDNCTITYTCDGYKDAARQILKTMGENKK